VRLLDQWRAEDNGPRYFVIGSVVRYWPVAVDCFLEEHPALRAKAIAFRKVCPYTFDPHLELVPSPEQILLPREVAERLGVCKRTLSYWREWGQGPDFVIGGDQLVRYTGHAIRTYIAYDEQQLTP
jgi:hypothetical protein